MLANSWTIKYDQFRGPFGFWYPIFEAIVTGTFKLPPTGGKQPLPVRFHWSWCPRRVGWLLVALSKVLMWYQQLDHLEKRQDWDLRLSQTMNLQLLASQKELFLVVGSCFPS